MFEPILWLMFGGELALGYAIVKTRESPKIQVLLFLFVTLLCLLIQPANVWLGKNWQTVATRNYFDEDGSFMAYYCGFPLLALSLLVLIFTVMNVWKVIGEIWSGKRVRKKTS